MPSTIVEETNENLPAEEEATVRFADLGLSDAVMQAVVDMGYETPTPVAIVVGTGRGAEMGVLFKNAEALETLQKVDTVVLDKTGTITRGKPAVVDILPQVRSDGSTMTQKQLMKLACALERGSEHPLAEAIMERADEMGIVARSVKDFRAIPGQGVTAHEGQNVIAAGNARLMDSLGIAYSNETLVTLSAQGKRRCSLPKTVSSWASSPSPTK